MSESVQRCALCSRVPQAGSYYCCVGCATALPHTPSCDSEPQRQALLHEHAAPAPCLHSGLVIDCASCWHGAYVRATRHVVSLLEVIDNHLDVGNEDALQEAYDEIAPMYYMADPPTRTGSDPQVGGAK